MTYPAGMPPGWVGVPPGWPMYQKYGGAIATFPDTAADLASIMTNGGLPTAIWLCDEASGNLVDEVGAQALVPSGGVTYQKVPSPWPAEFGVAFVDAGADFFADGGTSFGDASTTSVALLMVSEFPVLAGTRQAGGKFTSNTGYRFRATATGGLFMQGGDGSTTQQVTVATSHEANGYHTVLGVIDRTADTIAIHTDLGEQSATFTPTGNLDSATSFALSGSVTSTPGMTCVYYALWLGAAADGLVDADRAAFHTHIGL